MESTREFGVIRYPFLSSLPIFVTAPPRAGVPVTVIVNTYGSSSCITPDGMDVVYSGREVQLTDQVGDVLLHPVEVVGAGRLHIDGLHGVA